MPYILQFLTMTFVLSLVSCNENEQSGFAGGRKGDAERKESNGGRDGDDSAEDGDDESGDQSDDDDPGTTGDDDIKTDAGVDGSGSDLKNGSAKDEIEIDEAEIVAKIPGIEVVRVGVNFEDLGFSSGSDNDFNDAVLCFEGKFKVEKTDVVSIASQTVTGSTFSSSGCNHKVRVEITHKDGSKEPNIEFDSRDKNPVQMQFKTGSKLEVFMTPYKGCNEGVTRTMHQPQHALVKPNLCNDSGG